MPHCVLERMRSTVVGRAAARDASTPPATKRTPLFLDCFEYYSHYHVTQSTTSMRISYSQCALEYMKSIWRF